jgi:hypothetical protein
MRGSAAGASTEHMQKALQQMNVKLTEVVSSVTGVLLKNTDVFGFAWDRAP